MRRNPPIAGRARWGLLAVALMSVVSLFVITSRAQAVVVQINGTDYGVALVPAAREGTSTTASYLNGAGIQIATSTGTCADPAAGTEPDILTAGSWPLTAPAQPICWHGGQVMHANETFALEWEGQAPNTYWSDTKSYVQNFLGDVAADSGRLDNPFAITTQYWDGNSPQDRAANASVFGGGCDDNGTAKCQFGSITGSGPGNSLPTTNPCPVTGDNIWGGVGGGGRPNTVANNLCVTDSQIRQEVVSLVDKDGLIKYARPGHAPLVTVMTPPGAAVCLDAPGTLCSVNSRLAPPPPTVTSDSSTGTVAAGTYKVVVTYQTSSGETLSSGSSSVSATGAGSTITIASPPAHSGVTGWYAYVTQPDGSTYARQGSLNAIGQSYVLIAPPDGSGAAPPAGAASFCSYHAELLDPQSNQVVSYVVQPWTAFTSCDEPDVPALPTGSYTPQQLEKIAGQDLVSPLSQAETAAIVNPKLDGWFGMDGLEINDQNGCQPLAQSLDVFSFGNSGGSPYYLQRESNNATVVDSDPYTYNGCAPQDVLGPAFAAPSAINLGDTIDLDGSATASTLAIPNANYSWDFGDNWTGQGPSVEHAYAAAGTYTVTLTVTDRGGNQATFKEPIQVLGAAGQLPPSNPPTTTVTNVGSNNGLHVRIQLLPQALRSVLRSGIKLAVSSTGPANGIAYVSVSRATAKRLHLKVGHSPTVLIGRGTLSQIRSGTVMLHLFLSHKTAAKLKHLKHVTLNVRLSLVGAGGVRLAVDAAGRY